MLLTKRYTDDGISIQPERAGRIAGDVAIPTDAGEADPRLIHHGGRDSVYPGGAAQMIRISILVGEGDGERGDASVERPAFRIKGGDLICGAWISLYLDIALIILHE